ncbi:apoptosis antagonizing transcription factor [Toxoplasma gondii MAS]|uniref:Apoptosis antagonizing transcription factor n=1 Tax=Toxoplasma gondii MAS TaxID=943118 RepID=A0A086QZ65_TOXGO|nr:apoptosis antagonizing transcription factor [Toxoplasma gondii MAS]
MPPFSEVDETESSSGEEDSDVGSVDSEVDGEAEAPLDEHKLKQGSAMIEGGGRQKRCAGWRLELNAKLASEAERLTAKEQKHAKAGAGGFQLTAPEQSTEHQRKKAQKVQRQQSIVSDLLALRIRLNGALRETNRLPNAHMFTALMGEKCFESEKVGNTAETSSLAESLKGLRDEAAGLLTDLLSLQRALFEQSGLKLDAQDEDDAQDEEDAEDSSVCTPENGGGHETESWGTRRERWLAAQGASDSARASRGEKRKRADEEEAVTEDENSGREASVWAERVDALWRRKSRRLCLENADAWHTTVDPRSQAFKALSQPPSQQLQHAMSTQFSRLLARALRGAHVPPPSSPGNKTHASDEGCTPCHVVGCTTLQRLRALGEDVDQEEEKADGEEASFTDILKHDFYDDGDFYVELLKHVIQQGGALDSSDSLDREKNLLKLRNKLNRGRKTVDRRASKGRKIRYQPIEKLQNLMTATPWQPNLDALPGAGDEAMVDRLMRQLFAND